MCPQGQNIVAGLTSLRGPGEKPKRRQFMSKQSSHEQAVVADGMVGANRAEAKTRSWSNVGKRVHGASRGGTRSISVHADLAKIYGKRDSKNERMVGSGGFAGIRSASCTAGEAEWGAAEPETLRCTGCAGAEAGGAGELGAGAGTSCNCGETDWLWGHVTGRGSLLPSIDNLEV